MCSAEVMFTELDTGRVIFIDSADLMISEFNISFQTEQLAANQQYLITIEAANIFGLASSFTTTSEYSK